PDERVAVRGDFAESGETGGQALHDVLGLVVRRQAALWQGWRPWLVFVGLVATRHAAQPGLHSPGRLERHLFLDVLQQLGLGSTWAPRVLDYSRPDDYACFSGQLSADLPVVDPWFCARHPVASHHPGQRSFVL